MKIGDIIRRRREDLGLSVDELAERIGKSRATIYRYENGEIEKMPSTVIIPLAKALQTTPAELISWGNHLAREQTEEAPARKIEVLPISEDELEFIRNFRELDQIGRLFIEQVLTHEIERSRFVVQASAKEHRLIVEQSNIIRIYPYILNGASAGASLFSTETEVGSYEAPLKDGADFIIGISGDSMEPEYSNGDKVYIRKASELKIGEVGLFTIGNDFYIKRLGKNRLESINKEYPDILPHGDDRIMAVGRVIGKVI